MTEEASNIACWLWQGLTKWEINSEPTTMHEWEGGTKIHAPRRQLKSMLMNNTLIMLEKTIRHHKLNSSEPNKCNNYDTASQQKKDGDMQLFCKWMFINAHVWSYIWFYAFLSAWTSEHCLRGILSNIKEKKHSISPSPLPPSPLNSSHCWRCSLSEHSMSWKEVRGQEKQSGVMTTWCHQPKILSSWWDHWKSWPTCHSLLLIHVDNWI